MKIKIYFIKSVQCVLISALIYSCIISTARAKAWDNRQKNDNILRYALHASSLGNLDPDYEKGSQDSTYIDMVFNSLWRYVPGNVNHIEPDLALDIPEYRLENGTQIWTVRLRPNVYFHESPYCPAHEMTVRDVVFSIEKAGDPKRSSTAGYFCPMTFNILDSHTLEITLDKPMAPLYFLTMFFNRHGGAILSKQAIETGGYENFCKHPVGTGPFMFTSYDQNEKLILKANPRYFRGKPALDGVEIYFMPNPADREQAFRSGKVDVIYGTGAPGWIRKIEKEPETVVDIIDPGLTGMFHFNIGAEPLNDIRVRQAIVTCLDRTAFMQATSSRLMTECLSPMSSAFLPGGLKNEQVRVLTPGLMYNLDTARELLARAGFSKGFDLNVVVSEKRLYQETYKVLQSQLGKINIRLNMRTVSHARYHKLIREDVNPIVLYVAFRSNADLYLRGFFHSDSIVVTGATPLCNFSHYAGIDKILDDALETIDPWIQVAMRQQALIKILNDVVVFPLFDIKPCYVSRAYVDYHHPLIFSLVESPQFTEETRLIKAKPVDVYFFGK